MNDRVRKKDALHAQMPKLTPVEFILAFAGIALFFALLYATQTLSSPFVLIAALALVLYPLRSHPVLRNILALASLIFVLWLLKTIEMVIAPFIIALVLSYLLHPVVTRIERWGVPRWTSALFIILCAVAVIILLLMGIVPVIIQQFGSVLETLNSLSAQFTNWMMQGAVFRTLRRYGVSNGQLRNFLADSVAPRVQDIIKGLMSGAFGLVSEFSAVLTGIVNIVIIPFLTFFILKDFPLVKYRIKMLVPSARREEAATYYNYIDDIVGRYIRGTMIIAIFDAIMVSTVFWLIGIPYAMVIGLVSGTLFFLPYFGFLTMLVITTIVSTFADGPVLFTMLTGLGTLGALHVIENYVLSPKIIGSKIGLHPVLLILSLFIFGYFLGFIGLLIAIPAAGSIMVIAKEWEKKRKQRMQDDLFDAQEE
ncbi:MAG: AI-2E family transporter [Acidobacteriota bacterium]